MPRPAESHSRGEQCVRLRVASCTCGCLDVCAWETECDLCTGMRVWHQCVFKRKKKKKKKNNPKMKIHIEAANRGLTSATNSAKTEPFFPPKFQNICRPSLRLNAPHGTKRRHRNRRAQTTTTTQRRSKQRRRLCISLFSSQQTKWLPKRR